MTVPSPIPDLAIDIRNAIVLTGGFPALAGVDLQVESGQLVWLRGPNGAGKTTLLRLCAGLETLNSGSAKVIGHDLSIDSSAVRVDVGMLGHSNGLYEDLNAIENVRFVARASGRTATDASGALARFGIDGKPAKIPLMRLSAGQRRRVALAAVFVRSPRLWLLDEPHAGLDVEGRALLDSLMREQAASGCTVMFASHDEDAATKLATRVVDLIGGVVREASDQGARASTLNIPEPTYVA